MSTRRIPGGSSPSGEQTAGGESRRRTFQRGCGAEAANRGVVEASCDGIEGPLHGETVIESCLDRAFFDGMDAALKVHWQRYWVAELGVEEAVAKLTLDGRSIVEPGLDVS